MCNFFLKLFLFLLFLSILQIQTSCGTVHSSYKVLCFIFLHLGSLRERIFVYKFFASFIYSQNLLFTHDCLHVADQDMKISFQTSLIQIIGVCVCGFGKCFGLFENFGGFSCGFIAYEENYKFVFWIFY